MRAIQQPDVWPNPVPGIRQHADPAALTPFPGSSDAKGQVSPDCQ